MNTWQSIGHIEISNQWQYLLLLENYLLRLDHSVVGRAPEGLNAEMCLCTSLGEDMLTCSPKLIYPREESEVISFDIPYQNNWVLGAKLKNKKQNPSTQQYYFSWIVEVFKPLFAVPTNSRLGTNISTPHTISASTSCTLLLDTNLARKGATFWNQSTANLYLDLSDTVSVNAYTVKLAPDAYYELLFNYTGKISGIWNAEMGSVQIRELG